MYFAAYVIIVLFACAWILQSLNKFPGEIQKLQELKTNEKMDIFWPEAIALSINTIFCIILFVIMVVPLIKILFTGAIDFAKLIEGFRI